MTSDPVVPAVSRSQIDALLDAAGASDNRDVLVDIIRSAIGLAGDDVDRLDLKITASALKEMRMAFAAFRPFQHIRKVTVFGSARTSAQDPGYAQASALAARLAADDWMVVTGAGPGIMQAAMEGAGREKSFGVTIRLPFEERANDIIHGDQKLVSMKYFFTRKLMLVKESAAFCALPGGFGTQDETFELFTLQQTGKGQPAPVVLVDTPGGTYWSGWHDFVVDELVEGGLVSPEDLDLFLITDDVDAAVQEIDDFYRNYHSIRWVRDRLVIRLRQGPSPAQLEECNDRHQGLLRSGRIEITEALPAEHSSKDEVHLPRIVLDLNPYKQAAIRHLIDTVNSWVSTPH